MRDQFDFARFDRFHENNPHVYANLVKLAKQFRDKKPDGVIGIGMLYEVLRWNYYMTINTNEEYKLSNDFRAAYARLIMKQEPELSGIFKCKKSMFDEE